MIHAYIDESGIHEDAKACVICGYFGGLGQWRKFEKQWRMALQEFDVPLEEFHAKDLIQRHGFFKSWNDPKYYSFLEELAKALTLHKLYPVSFGILVEDFWSFSEKERKVMTGGTICADGKLLTPGCCKRPYFVPFQWLMRTVASHTGVGGKAHFYFGLGNSFSKSALWLFHYIKTRPSAPYVARLGDIAFPLAKETPQLQAADLLSYLTYEHMLERMLTGDWESYPNRTILKSIIQNRIVREDTVYLDKKCMTGALAQIPVSFSND
jgi:hypothetical protein